MYKASSLLLGRNGVEVRIRMLRDGREWRCPGAGRNETRSTSDAKRSRPRRPGRRVLSESLMRFRAVIRAKFASDVKRPRSGFQTDAWVPGCQSWRCRP